MINDGVFLLLVAAAKGNTGIMNLMFQNKGLDINKTDRYGVNAFWIASFYSKIDAMRMLAQKKVNILATN